MTVETLKETLHVNKSVATKKEIIMIEGDMIVPDSKPDILKTISTSGITSIYKKEVLDGKIKVDGNINTYIMYMSEDDTDKVRGLTTNLDFSENIQITNAKEGMNCKLKTTLKNIEARVINGRKIGIKATMEMEFNVYSDEEIEFIRDIPETQEIKMLKENLTVNSLVGMGENKIYAKDTIAINNVDNLAEILKSNISIGDKDIKVSYNKILTKAEAEIKILYLTEDNRIGNVETKVPVVGFTDIANVTEENICDVDYEIKNVVIKPNSSEEHSIYIEIEVGVTAFVYEEKQMQLIQDLYSPIDTLEFNQRKITTITGKSSNIGIKQIREKITLQDIENKNIIDVDIIPIIEKEEKRDNIVRYEGQLELNVILASSELQIDTRNVKIPFEYDVDIMEDISNSNISLTMEIQNQDFLVQDGGIVNCNIDIQMDIDVSKNTTINVIDELEIIGEREKEDYSILMYIVKKGDSLWKIAKEFGSSVEDIARTNGIEDENKIMPGQKIFIPNYTKLKMTNNV